MGAVDQSEFKTRLIEAVVEEYLKSSGLANASLLLGGFLENYWKYVNAASALEFILT